MSGDNFVVVITGTVRVPEAGLWSFSVGSDDGFSAKISRLEKSWSWENRGARSYGQSTATFNLPEAGAYDVELVYFEKGGGAVLHLRDVEHSPLLLRQDVPVDNFRGGHA